MIIIALLYKMFGHVGHLQVVLLGGQGIWYEQPIRAQSLGRDSPAIRGMKKAELRRHLKSKLGLEEDRCATNLLCAYHYHFIRNVATLL